MIIDSHQHIGDCRVFDHEISSSELMEAMDKNGVNVSLVMPFPGASNESAVHTEIFELSQKHTNRIFGIVSLNPHIDEDVYFNEVERCVNKLGFVGLKLHPYGHACPVDAKDASKVFVAAREYNIPLIIHSGLGAPYALPSMFIPRAKEFSDVKIVIAHSGAYIYTAEAILAAQECPNIYLETSWCGPHRIKQMADELGPDRVMLGSDICSNIATELTKYRTNGLTSEQFDICMFETARQVFNLPL